MKSLDTFKRSIGELLVANGFYEILTNSLTNQAYQTRHSLTFKGETIEILNKLSEEQGILRADFAVYRAGGLRAQYQPKATGPEAIRVRQDIL